jgi:hypothetical protein
MSCVTHDPAGNGQPRYIAVKLAAASVLLAALGTACGGSPGHPGGQATASPSGTSPSSRIPTGTQLQALLPYHDNQPAGWQLVNASGSVRNSGSTVRPPLGLTPTSSDCSLVAIPPSALAMVTNWWAASWAYSLMQQLAPGPDGPETPHNLTLVLGAFQPGYAQKQISWYATDAVRCHSYTDQGGTSWATTPSAIQGLGDQALYIQNVSSAYTQQELLVRVGNNMAALSQDGALGPLLPLPQFEAAAQVLAQRLDGV